MAKGLRFCGRECMIGMQVIGKGWVVGIFGKFIGLAMACGDI